MKTMINMPMWQELEEVLTKLNVGYKVNFDNHHGIAEMLISVDTIGIMRREVFSSDHELED